jgi:hypothetical protein
MRARSLLRRLDRRADAQSGGFRVVDLSPLIWDEIRRVAELLRLPERTHFEERELAAFLERCPAAREALTSPQPGDFILDGIDARL